MPLTTIDPTAALVVVDLQKGIVSALADDTPVTSAVQQATHLAAEFRRHGLPWSWSTSPAARRDVPTAPPGYASTPASPPTPLPRPPVGPTSSTNSTYSRPTT